MSPLTTLACRWLHFTWALWTGGWHAHCIFWLCIQCCKNLSGSWPMSHRQWHLVRLAPQLAAPWKFQFQVLWTFTVIKHGLGHINASLVTKSGSACVHCTDQYTLGNVLLDPFYYISLVMVLQTVNEFVNQCLNVLWLRYYLVRWHPWSVQSHDECSNCCSVIWCLWSSGSKAAVWTEQRLRVSVTRMCTVRAMMQCWTKPLPSGFEPERLAAVDFESTPLTTRA